MFFYQNDPHIPINVPSYITLSLGSSVVSYSKHTIKDFSDKSQTINKTPKANKGKAYFPLLNLNNEQSIRAYSFLKPGQQGQYYDTGLLLD